MRIRSGFVSNSSSSSFIFVFDRKPKNAEDLKKIMFGNQKTVHYFDYEFTTQHMAEIIFNSFRKLALKKDIHNFFRRSWMGKYNSFRTLSFAIMSRKREPVIDDFPPRICLYDPFEYDFPAYNIAHAKYTDEIATKFRAVYKGKKIYVAEYDNGTPEGAILDYGKIFKKIPHLKISHH